MDLIQLDPGGKEPLYVQLYQHYKREIENSRLKEGEKLPSIRRLAKGLSISKITVEKAYLQLMSEGYIENSDRSRYTVSKFEGIGFKGVAGPVVRRQEPDDRANRILYDFASGEMDINGFDFSLWKRYISRSFLEKDRLVGYGNVKGEESLRREIAAYIRRSRGVYADKEQIVVGAGVQSLLGALCPILKKFNNSIAFEEPGFKHGRRIFHDHAFAIVPVQMGKDGIDMGELGRSGVRMVYLSPSHQFPTGYIMPVGKRNRLLRWAEQMDGIIIEDDYDSEFRYFGRPIPALKGMDNGGNVVYLSSFSKVIPPSIRISYMVLPEKLLDIYEQNSGLYNQTASMLEQLALARFMEDGHFERQIRRLRKLYHEKSRRLFTLLRQVFGDRVEVNAAESGLHTILKVKSPLSARELAARALAKGCRAAPVQDYYLQSMESSADQFPQIILYFSKIPAGDMETAVTLLGEAWFGGRA